jgi:hypothetical protein
MSAPSLGPVRPEHGPHQRHRAPRTRLTCAVRRACVAAVAVSLSSVVLAAPRVADAATTSQPVVFGASGGDEVAKLSANIGAPLAKHVYGQLDGSVPTGRMVNMATNVSWRTLAGSQAGSAPYADLVRWADALKSRTGGPILFVFNHEPEGNASSGLGTDTDFIAAWRKVHDVFGSRGVTNVEYTWNMTSNAFRVPSSDPRYALKWYPGDAYVDNVATAAYNWYDCGEGHGQWLSLENRASAPLAFAKAHGKPYVLAEWASQAGPLRASWLQDARTWMLANKGYLRGAFYYQSPTPRAGCSWRLTTTAEFQAFGAMAKDRANFGG